MSRMWWYTLSVLALWIVNPELRRLCDWRFGFSQVEIISIIPLASLIPHAWSLSVGGGWRRLPRSLAIAAWCWIGGFSYAFLLACIYGNIFSGIYAYLAYTLPIGAGLWIAADETEMTVSYARITRMLFGLTTVVSVYGIIQYLYLPPWDEFWLYSSIAATSGSSAHPDPNHVRIFSTLNSPGPFGTFMASILLVSLPQLSMRRPLLLAQVPIWLIAFGLSFVRAGWLMFALGLCVYVFLSPRPGAIVTVIGTCTALFLGVTAFLPAATGNDAIVTDINQRLETFSSLDRDVSAQERGALVGDAMEQFFDAPLGRGLGVTGTSTKLSDAAETTDFDNGYLARLIEMGVPGSALYGATFALLFFPILRLWRTAKKIGAISLQSLTAMAIALECACLSVLLAGELSGLQLLLFWLFVSNSSQRA